MNWQLLKAYGVQVFIAVDQLANALIPPIDGTLSYADETLSARSYRAHRDGKLLGKITMPIIDALFWWQGPNHCFHAYRKEHERQNLPSEYRPAHAGFLRPTNEHNTNHPPNEPRFTSRSQH